VELPPDFAPNERGPGFTLGEHLEFIADHANIPVIGDAFRVFCSSAEYKSASTVGGYLNALKESKYDHQGHLPAPISYYRAKDGWLFVRHYAFWRRFACEIPESVLQPIEAIAQSKPFLTTDEYASFVGGLSSDQAEPLHREWPWSHEVAFRFQPSPIHDAFLSLKLWSTLSDSQKALADGIGLNLNDIDPQQAEILTEYGEKWMWNCGFSVDMWSEVFGHSIEHYHPVFKHSVSTNKAGETISFMVNLFTLGLGEEATVAAKAK